VTWDYGSLASEVYELDKPIGHSFGDVEYYTGALTGTEGPVLEPAVGTGRMLIPLLQAGLQVEGFDVSPHMLAICRGHCAERGLDPVLSEADMTTFTSPGRYAAVILPAGSFGLVAGREAALTAFGCFRDSLRVGGRLMLDLDAPGLTTGPASDQVRHWRRDPFLWTLQTMKIEQDRAAQQVTWFGRYEKWQDGGLIATELQLLRFQYWSLTEFTSLLTEAGFTGIEVTASYQDGRPPGPDDATWTFHAHRA
jgi:SAM-dependent methyltransferase